MLSIFGAPARYVQGPGALDTIGQEVKALGSRAVLVVDPVVRPIVARRIEEACWSAGIDIRCITFTGDITPEEVARLSTLVDDRDEVVIAAGGGKTIDAGKGVCKAIRAAMVSVPTIASNDAPTSRNFVLYDDHHRMVAVERLERNPDVVLVDTALIVRAPKRLFVSGIGDAIVKSFEVAQCMASGRPNVFGGRALGIAAMIADGCYAVIRAQAEGALRAIDAGAPDEAFERTTEATVLLSGLAFENGGLSVTHAMTRGLSAVRGASAAPHGFQVAYALMVQLTLERRPSSFVDELGAFYAKVGLPQSLEEIGLPDPSADELARIADLSLAAPHAASFFRPLDRDTFVAALRATARRPDVTPS